MRSQNGRRDGTDSSRGESGDISGSIDGQPLVVDPLGVISGLQAHQFVRSCSESPNVGQCIRRAGRVCAWWAVDVWPPGMADTLRLDEADSRGTARGYR